MENSAQLTQRSTAQLGLLGLGLTLMTGFNLLLLTWIQNRIHLDQFQIGANGQTRTDSANLVGGLVIRGGLEVPEIQSVKSGLRISDVSGVILGSPPGVQLSLGPHSIRATARNLIIRSPHDDRLLVLLQTSPELRTVLGVNNLVLNSKYSIPEVGAIQVGAINTSGLLLLNSHTRRVMLRGVRGVHMQTPLFTTRSDRHLHITSRTAQVQLESLQFTENLLTIHGSSHGQTYPSVGQVCVCASNGRLFTAPATQTCYATARLHCTD